MKTPTVGYCQLSIKPDLDEHLSNLGYQKFPPKGASHQDSHILTAIAMTDSLNGTF